MASSSNISKTAVGLPLIALTVTALTYVGLNSNSQNGNSQNGNALNQSVQSTLKSNGQDDNDAVKNLTAVPESNAGWVLVPFFGAVLLFSARHLFRGKATE